MCLILTYPFTSCVETLYQCLYCRFSFSKLSRYLQSFGANFLHCPPPTPKVPVSGVVLLNFFSCFSSFLSSFRSQAGLFSRAYNNPNPKVPTVVSSYYTGLFSRAYNNPNPKVTQCRSPFLMRVCSVVQTVTLTPGILNVMVTFKSGCVQSRVQ